MAETLREFGSLLPNDFLAKLRQEWTDGVNEVARTKLVDVHAQSPGPTHSRQRLC